ncbi:low molecular weight protein-tyrosine-phosphatase [Crocinitomix algicola]|uniref:low molecular weight protein-tyrosine-phosphatase n=1 Tax=Crocinitomix algicola TaxID=1740263 RepID=UPI000872458C|nr:low molecular weight protein-tyrosine-phosphatase [Crocinitomix algicola]
MKVLMVCLGNICRSPIAEGILRAKVAEQHLDIRTDSAGTAAYHVGNPPDSRMILTAKKNGYDISDLRARQFTVEDFDQFDLIFAMDQSNYNNILKLARNSNDEEKVRLMLNETAPGANSEVPDPYYGGDQGFQHVIDLLEEAIESFLSRTNG